MATRTYLPLTNWLAYQRTQAAVRVYDYGNPTVTANRIYGGRSAGVLVFEFGRGTFADNDIHDNRGWNVEIRQDHAACSRGCNRVQQGCSLLQPRSPTVAASMTHGCSLDGPRLQPR